MTTFIREIYPVGQGGFAYENMGGYSIVFDCGSITSPTRVTQYINDLRAMQNGRIDRLYISHFDKDHINSITELIDNVGVKRAIIPYVPKEFRVVYNAVTNGAYSSIRETLSNRDIELNELQEENTISEEIWEWISKPMLTMDDWNRLEYELIREDVDPGLLNDPAYVDLKKYTINICFKTVFGPQGPNSKGLLLLSQKICGSAFLNVLCVNGNEYNIQGTAALYTGDANLKNRQIKGEVKHFIDMRVRDSLALMQIPHHGSSDNVGCRFDIDFPASYYYYHDKSSERLRRNLPLYDNLTSSHKLLDVRDIGSDLIEQIVRIDP